MKQTKYRFLFQNDDYEIVSAWNIYAASILACAEEIKSLGTLTSIVRVEEEINGRFTFVSDVKSCINVHPRYAEFND